MPPTAKGGTTFSVKNLFHSVVANHGPLECVFKGWNTYRGHDRATIHVPGDQDYVVKIGEEAASPGYVEAWKQMPRDTLLRITCDGSAKDNEATVTYEVLGAAPAEPDRPAASAEAARQASPAPSHPQDFGYGYPSVYDAFSDAYVAAKALWGQHPELAITGEHVRATAASMLIERRDAYRAHGYLVPLLPPVDEPAPAQADTPRANDTQVDALKKAFEAYRAFVPEKEEKGLDRLIAMFMQGDPVPERRILAAIEYIGTIAEQVRDEQHAEQGSLGSEDDLPF
jgi:hypothetical protein